LGAKLQKNFDICKKKCTFAPKFIRYPVQIDIITYLSGISNAIYAFTCLMCGLQLCVGIFSQHRHANTLLSQILGSSLLIMTVSAICYLLSTLLPDAAFLYRIGTSIDIFIFTGYTMVGYALCTNNEPSKLKLIALASPFAICAILNICFPNYLTVLFFVAAAILFAYYIYFGVAIQRRERVLDDLYSDPESHSLRWIWVAIALFAGWWIFSGLFLLVPILLPWYNTAILAYMTILILFVFAKVSNHKQPVSLATQQEMEETSHLSPLTSHLSPTRLSELMEQEQLYLNPDLTVEDVVKRLGTNTKYFSALLRIEMHTTFSQFVNEYRIERAKQLLQDKDEKVVNLAQQCGFNSNQSFYRTFSKFTGTTPTEWRSK